MSGEGQQTVQAQIEGGHGTLSVSGFPIHGAVVTPHDTNDLASPGYVRADGAGAIVVLPYGSAAAITLNVVAGEFVPCMVLRVLSTGTVATPLHVFF